MSQTVSLHWIGNLLDITDIFDLYIKRFTHTDAAILSRSLQFGICLGLDILAPRTGHFKKGIFLHWSLLPPKHSISVHHRQGTANEERFTIQFSPKDLV